MGKDELRNRRTTTCNLVPLKREANFPQPPRAGVWRPQYALPLDLLLLGKATGGESVEVGIGEASLPVS